MGTNSQPSISYQTLISASELARHLSCGSWRLFDCRASLMELEAGASAYRAGHLPGALHADLEKDLSGPPHPGNSGRHPLPARDALSEQFRLWGIDNDTQLVCYDDAGGAMAARFWWLARWLGVSQVAVLDGGIQSWLEADQKLEKGEEPFPGNGNFSPAKPLTRQVRALDILAAISPETQPDPRTANTLPGLLPCLIDARSQARFDAEVEPIDTLAGHIPGACCLPFNDNLQDNGRFKTAADLHTRFSASVEPGADVICYCGSGVTAAHNILALNIAGYPEAALYPGSWSEWIEDEERPVIPPRPPDHRLGYDPE